MFWCILLQFVAKLRLFEDISIMFAYFRSENSSSFSRYGSKAANGPGLVLPC